MTLWYPHALTRVFAQDGYTLEVLDIFGIVDGHEQVVISNVSGYLLALLMERSISAGLGLS